MILHHKIIAVDFIRLATDLSSPQEEDRFLINHYLPFVVSSLVIKALTIVNLAIAIKDGTTQDNNHSSNGILIEDTTGFVINEGTKALSGLLLLFSTTPLLRHSSRHAKLQAAVFILLSGSYIINTVFTLFNHYAPSSSNTPPLYVSSAANYVIYDCKIPFDLRQMGTTIREKIHSWEQLPLRLPVCHKTHQFKKKVMFKLKLNLLGYMFYDLYCLVLTPGILRGRNSSTLVLVMTSIGLLGQFIALYLSCTKPNQSGIIDRLHWLSAYTKDEDDLKGLYLKLF